MNWLNWLRSSSIRVFTLALAVMVITPIFLYQAVQTGSTNVIWFLLGLLVFANLLILWMD